MSLVGLIPTEVSLAAAIAICAIAFVSAGPMLSRKIPVSVGDTVEREGFAFADLVPT